MSALVLTIAYIFGLIALGYLSGLTGLLKAETGSALTDFVMTIALPALLFRTMVTADFGAVAPWSLWGAYFAAAAMSWLIGQAITAYVFGRDRRASIIGGVTSAFSNLVLLGLPFVLSAFGHDGVSVLSLVVAVHLPTMLAVSVVLFALAPQEGSERVDAMREFRSFVRTLATNPLVVGILLGLLWRVGGLAMPPFGTRIVDTFASIAGPLALFSVGLGMRRFGLSGNLAPAAVLSTVKLGLMPLLVLGISLLLHLPPLTAKVAVVSAAMPTGVNPYLFAMRFGTGQALSSNVVVIGTLASALTLAGWLAVVTALFG
jgi:predicted permease